MELLPFNGWQNISPWHWEAFFVGGKPLTIVSWHLNRLHLGDIELSPFAAGNGLVVWFLRRIYDLHTINVLIYS